MRKLPKAVMEAAKRADAILTPVDTNPVVEEEVIDPVQTDPVEVQPVPSEPSVVEVKPVEPTVKPTEPKSREDDPKYWEHRFKTLQGISEAEKNRYKSEMDSMKETLSQLKSQLKEVKVANPTVFDFSKILTEDEMDTYTPETLKVLAKVANKAAEQAVKEAIDEFTETNVQPMAQRVQQSEHAAMQSKVENFWVTIETALPNWEQVNNSKEFLTWLGEVDPITGNSRQDYLTAAQNDLRADRVLAIFKAYLGSIKPAQTPVKTIEPEPVQSQPLRKTTVDAVSRAEIKRFQTDVALGRYRTRPSEKDAMERKIAAAMAAGTIY